jgi:putative membrane protein
MSLSEAEAWVPLFNMLLIVISGVFLLAGYGLIRLRRVQWHHRSMLTASVFAALFLVVYVARYLLFGSKLFAGEGLGRILYLTLLVSHVVIAIAIGPLAFVTIRRAMRREFARHRRLARITLPLWLYVVVTGYAVYVWLYRV